MSYCPTRIDYPGISHITRLTWPADSIRIALMSQGDKEIWYASREPRELIYESEAFKRFWRNWYIKPLKVKRFFYSFKFW